MTTKNHTPIATGAAANASTFNTPLGSLDAKMGDVASVTTHTGSPAVQTPDLAAAINALDAQKLESGASAALITNTPTGNVTQETVQLAINQLDTIKQPLDSDLTAIAALAPDDDDVIQRKAGAWTNRTMAELKDDLVLTAGDVTSSATANISAGTVQTAIAELDADKAALSHTHTVSQITNVTSVKLDDFAAPEDNTDLDVSTNTHGLFPKLVSDAMQLFNGVGSWVKWAMGIKDTGGGIFTPRKYLQFRGSGVELEDDYANDTIKVTISGGGIGAVADIIDLADVLISSPVHNQILAYDDQSNPTAPVWKNKLASAIATQGHIIMNEGSVSGLGPRGTLNFVGSGVEVTDDPGNGYTQITVLGSNQNYLFNGGFDLAQRQVPTTLTTLVTEKYSADRWRISCPVASLQYLRVANAGETGISSQFYGRYSKLTTGGKFAVYQIIENANTIPLRGKTVTFTIKVRASAVRDVKVAILQYVGAVPDVLPAIVSAMGADGVTPTFGASLSIISSAMPYTTSASWVEITVTRSVPTTAKNLICMLWTDDAVGAGEILYVAEAGLYNASSPPVWDPRPIAQEITLCQRYYEKSYPLDVKPMTVSNAGLIVYRVPVLGAAAANITTYVPFQVLKRSSPSISTYGNVLYAALPTTSGCQLFNAVSGTVIATIYATSLSYSSGKGFSVAQSATSITKAGMQFHFTAENEL